MNKSLKNDLDLYYKEISALVLCEKKKKAEILKSLKVEIADYLEASPDSDMDEIRAVFGSPEEIAAGFSAELSQNEIRKKLSIRKAVIAVLLFALLVWTIFAAISLIDVHTEAHGYFREGLLYIYNVWGGEAL